MQRGVVKTGVMAIDIETALRKFDGKDTEPLEKFSSSVSPDAERVSLLIDFLHKSEQQSQAASWILKRWWESGWQFSVQQSKQLIVVLLQAQDWQLRLHLLQLLSGLAIAESQHRELYYHLRYNLEDKNKFVRAWTYNGLAVVAKQYPQYRDEVVQLFELAIKDEAASVKARIRNIKI